MERVLAEKITELMAGRSTEEAKRMLFEGAEMVAQQGGETVVEESGEVKEIWKRVRVGGRTHEGSPSRIRPRGGLADQVVIQLDSVSAKSRIDSPGGRKIA